MTAAADSQPTARFARRPARGAMLGLSWWRLAACGAAIGCVLAGLLSGRGGLGLFVGVAAGSPFVAAGFIRVAGRPAVEWIPTVSSFLLRRVRGQTEYVAKMDRPRSAGTLALPGDAASLRFWLDPPSGTCMIHDPYRSTLCAILRVSHPAYVLLGPEQQSARVHAYGRLLAGLSPSGTCAGVQIVEATIPDAGRSLDAWYAVHGDPEAGWAAEQYEELLASTSAAATTHRTTITLSLDMKAASRQIKASGGGVAGAARVLRGDIEALEYSLRSADLSFGHWMREEEIAHVVRAAYDPRLGGEFTPSSPGANLTHAGPLAVSERWDRIRHDSGWSAVLWISEWPRIEAPAHFLHALVFSPAVQKAFSLVARPLPTAEALRQIRREKTDWIGDADQKQKVGQIQDLSDVQEYEDLEARERALIAGHADVAFTGLLTVTARSEEELDAATRQVERAASQAGCETRVLYGQQSQAFVAALPLGRSTLP